MTAKPQTGASRALDRSLLLVEALVGVGVVVALVGKIYGPAPTLIFLLAGGALTFTGLAFTRGLAALRDRSLDAGERPRDERREALEEEKHLILQGIKELEADAAVGKVDPADYQHLRSTAERRALTIIGALKAIDDRRLAAAEALLAERLGQPAPRPPAVDALQASAPSRALAFAGLFDPRPVTLGLDGGAHACSGCAGKNDPDARFCIHCGRPIAAVGPAGTETAPHAAEEPRT